MPSFESRKISKTEVTQPPESAPQIMTMTFEEYAGIEHPTPYVFELEKDNKRLVYFGASHSNIPRDPLFNKLQAKFDQTQPELVFVEGVMRFQERKKELIESLQHADRDQVINEGGESLFTLKLAAEAGVEVDVPEPSDKSIIRNLLQQGFSPDAIFAHEVYLIIDQYYRIPERPDLEKYLSRYINEFQSVTNWSGFEYSLAHAQQIGETIWGREKANPHVAKFAGPRVDPTPSKETAKYQTMISKIARETSYARDRFMVKKIQEALEGYNRLFVVFGASHAVMQEGALRKLFSDLRAD